MATYTRKIKKELFDKKIKILNQKTQELFKSKNVKFETRWFCSRCGHSWVRRVENKFKKPLSCPNVMCRTKKWEAVQDYENIKKNNR